MSESLSTDIVVIGAGVVGLAIASELSKKNDLILVEQYPQFGRETSSRNSEVVHSGIYYPKDSLKSTWCIEGRKLLYDYCADKQIPYKKCGKFLVATNTSEEAYLEKKYAHAKDLGVLVERFSKNSIDSNEPLVQATSALFFSESGIVDSHVFMQRLEDSIRENGGTLAYNHLVQSISKQSNWTTIVKSSEGDFEIKSKKVINCAGLAAAELSNKVLSTNKYEHRYCRGRYFSLSQKYQNQFKHLIYPVPPKDGLGVHVTIDSAGFAKLGPDVDWCLGKYYKDVNSLYDCDWENLLAPFTASAQAYLPDLQLKDLSAGLIGIRPKLFIDGNAHSDFLVEEFDGFTHCLGIESPGLTASLAIAKYISGF